MSNQKPEKCYCCGIIISQVENMSWVRKANMWTLKLVYWPIHVGEYKKSIEERICDKCKNELMNWLNK